jgi:outer membrane protein TolC
VWCSLVWAALAGVVPARAAELLSVDEVVRTAIGASPDVVAAESDVLSATGVRRSRSIFLENPQAEAELALDGSHAAAEIVQPLSLTGEGWFARSEARSLVGAAEASRDRTFVVVAARARLAWADAILAAEQAAITAEGRELATRVRTVVESRARIGEAAPLDAALARSAEARAVADALAAQRRVTDALLALARFHPDAITRGVGGDPFDAVPRSAGTEQRERGDVVAAAARSEAAHAALSRSRAAALPLVGVGAFVEDEGTTVAGPKLTLEVPFWDRNQIGRSEARAAVATADAELDTVRAAASAEQLLYTRTASLARDDLARLGGFDEDARRAATFVADGLERGELDVRDAVLLEDELFVGRIAALGAARDAIAAQLDALVAVDDPNLLPSGASR